MGVIPSKADPDKRKAFLHGTLEALLEEEKQGSRRVFFVDAVHFVMGAYSIKETELITITNNAYINSNTLVELLTAINRLHSDTAVTLVMENSRYQGCDKVMAKTKEFVIDLLFLPPYSPNLNLIERLWKFTNKQCLYNRYYETFHQFEAAIDDCLGKVKSTFSEQIKTLLNPKFQLFEKIRILDRRVRYYFENSPDDLKSPMTVS